MTLLLSVLLACGTSAHDVDSAADLGETAEDTAPACAVLDPGEDWAWNGDCPQMRTPCEIVVDGCDVEIAYSSGMTMGMPYAGTIDGDTITFQDGDTVDGCVGTVEDADKVTGSCGGGCTFTLRRR